jgi:hypothetical protein
MHLEIDKLYFRGDRVGIDFEYDDDFQNKVADLCGVPQLSKRQLQIFIVKILENAISQENILELKQYVD